MVPVNGRRAADFAPSRDSATILHVDMDAFFVSVEVRDDPSLRGKPVVVGGVGARGVVAAANYEARVFGIRSAMPSNAAQRACPHAIFIPGNHKLYAQVSRGIMDVFERVTPLYEPLSLDEAFLDVAGSERLLGPAPEIAQQIRKTIWDEHRLHCSVGVAGSKLIAKLASQDAKPIVAGRRVERGLGVKVVEVGTEREYLKLMPIRAMWGVGPKSAERLARLGITTVGEIADLPLAVLIRAVGDSNGRHLNAVANGRDSRPVEVHRPTKSISNERTFRSDISDPDRLHAEAVRLADSVAGRTRTAGLRARTVSVKVRYGSFETLSRSRSLAHPSDSSREILETVTELLSLIDTGQGVRLLGVALSGLTDDFNDQLSFDDLLNPDKSGSQVRDLSKQNATKKSRAVVTNNAARRAASSVTDQAVDEIRSKFGSSAIGPATLVSPKGEKGGIERIETGGQQWGPNDAPEETEKA